VHPSAVPGCEPGLHETVAMSNSRDARATRYPNPCVDATNSESRAPSIARVTVIRMLATIAGAAEGSVTFSSRSRRLAPSTRHTRSSPGCTSRMPVAVLTNTTK
jgi:hypothetical protein